MKKILFFYLLTYLGAQNDYELENLVIFEDKYLILLSFTFALKQHADIR